MKKWIGGIVTAVISGVIIFWLTEGIKEINKPSGDFLLADDIQNLIKIEGSWRDSKYPRNVTEIVQDGESFNFNGRGFLTNGVQYNSSGSGKIKGKNVKNSYKIKYQNGFGSKGSCFGTVSSDGEYMEQSCQDSVLGNLFITSNRK